MIEQEGDDAAANCGRRFQPVIMRQAMSDETPAIRIARNHLQAGIAELEADARVGRYHLLCTRSLAGAAELLGQREIVSRATQLLRGAPDASFFQGVLTNIELPNTIPPSLRTIGTVENLEDEHPPYSEEGVVAQIRLCATAETHLELCLNGQIESARLSAGLGVRLEEVGETFAVLGKFDAALSVARFPLLEQSRRNGVLLVLAIELFRRGRSEEYASIIAELETNGINAWRRTHLALGLAGRMPWCGYPFPDY